MNAVTCATWLKSGTLSYKPKKHIAKSANPIESIVKNIEKDNSTSRNEINRIINDYDLDDYSSDDDTSRLQNLASFPENKNDSYMTEYMKQNENSSSEEDDIIEQSDGIIVVGKTHRDYHSLEVWVVNKDEDNHINSYCHHDYILNACPLDIKFLSNINVNLAVVSSLSPIIQFWDLDTMNVVDPMFALGNSHRQEGHSDAVLSLSTKFLSCNTSLLLSGSADGTVILWSIKEGGGQCVQKSSLGHSDKIQAVQWHPIEDSIFATGSFDKIMHVYDCRTCFQSKQKADCKWTVNGEVEQIIWDIHQPFNIFAATSSGSVHYFDIRMKQPLWLLNTHNPASTTGVAQCHFNDHCLVTTSDEGKVKIWDTKKSQAELVSTKSYKIGSIYCVAPSPEEPMNFCVGGEREMKIVDLKKDTKVKDHFSNIYSEKGIKHLSGTSFKSLNNINKIDCSNTNNEKNLLEFESSINFDKKQNEKFKYIDHNNLKNLVIKKNKKQNSFHTHIDTESIFLKKCQQSSYRKDNSDIISTNEDKKDKPLKKKRKKMKVKINDG